MNQIGLNLNLSSCKSSMEFIENVKRLNQCDWSKNNITAEVIKTFLNQNEVHFPQVMMDAREMQAMSKLAVKISKELGTSKEKEELIEKTSRVTTTSFQHLPQELKQLVIDQMICSAPEDFRKATKLQRTSKQWYGMVRAAQANCFNRNRFPLGRLKFNILNLHPLTQFLVQMNNPGKEDSAAKRSWITCLNFHGFSRNPLVNIAPQINSVLRLCPQVEAVTIGPFEMALLEDYDFFKEAAFIEGQSKNLKLFQFEEKVFTFHRLQQYSTLSVLYPDAQIRIASNGRFTSRPQEAQAVARTLKEGEYVISTRKGEPGVYDVMHRTDGVLYSMKIGPANNSNLDRANVPIEKEMNTKKWLSHPERPLDSLYLNHTELLEYLRRQPESNEVLNLSHLYDAYTSWINAGGARNWDAYLRDIFQWSAPRLKTILTDTPEWLLNYTEDLALVIKESGCSQLSAIKFQGMPEAGSDPRNQEWYPYHFVQLSKIKAALPLLKIELPINGHFAANMGEAKELLSTPGLPDKSYAVWPSRSTPGAYGLIFIHNGKVIEKPYLINQPQQPNNIVETNFFTRDLLEDINLAFEKEKRINADVQRDPLKVNQPVSR